MNAHQRMSPADAAWLRMDRPTNLMVIHGLLWLDASPQWSVVKAAFRERLFDVFPRFTQRPRQHPIRGAAWEDAPDFDADAHFHHVALPAPGDRSALETLVGELASQPIAPDRPLWEAYLIDGYGDGAAILVRIHHAVADGIALGRVMLRLTDGAAVPNLVASTAPRDGRSRLRATARVGAAAAATGARAALAVARDPAAVGPAAARARRDAGALAKLVLPGAETSNALKGRPRIARRVAWSAPVDLWRVKAVGREYDATVNDVLVAAVAGALRRRVAARADDVHALVPFNLRPLDEPVPRDLGNRFGLVLLRLPLATDDPLERLLEVRARMAEIKATDEGLLSYGILETMGLLPVRLERLLIDYFTGKASLVLTNVPGPRRRVSLAGVPVDGVLVWAPCSGSLEMSVSVFSYAGKVTVGFLVDAALDDRPQALADAFRAELLAYGRLALSRRTAPRSGPRTDRSRPRA
jgi:WS/DGAT/MGAT family acyltransferase